MRFCTEIRSSFCHFHIPGDRGIQSMSVIASRDQNEPQGF